MAVKVALEDVLEAMERPEDWFAFVDRESGEVFTVSDEAWAIAEREDEGEDAGDADDVPDWQAEEIEIARRAVRDPQRHPTLPTKFDIHEWDIMRRFAESRKNPRHREALMDSIHGSGAFRCFRRELERLNIVDSWFSFRAEAFAEIAKEWLEDEGFEYE